MSNPGTALMIAVGAFALAGCAAPHGADEPVAATPADLHGTSSTLPTPYTAEQIRDANPPGTRLVYRIEQEGQPTAHRTMVFVSGDAERTVVEDHATTPDGASLGDPESGASTWTELRDHAAFPASRTTRDRATCRTSAGRFDCWRYTVVDDDGAATSVFHFALDRPGPPVLYEIHRDGRRVMRMELLEDSRG